MNDDDTPVYSVVIKIKGAITFIKAKYWNRQKEDVNCIERGFDPHGV
ncbi:MAG: hypothetical protein HMLIMOIP_002313 [Candidatus Nitrosomirales archaeon]